MEEDAALESLTETPPKEVQAAGVALVHRASGRHLDRHHPAVGSLHDDVHLDAGTVAEVSERQRFARRQLAATAGVAPGNASSVIEDLILSGLVSETVAGRSSMVVLNRNHLAAGPLVMLAGSRSELIRRLRERLSGWPELRGAWLFGSVARGEAGRNSDIDLLLVADDLESPGLHERLSQLQADVRTWTGNDLQVVEHSPASWRKLVRSKNPLVEQIRGDGTALAGDTALLLKRVK